MTISTITRTGGLACISEEPGTPTPNPDPTPNPTGPSWFAGKNAITPPTLSNPIVIELDPATTPQGFVAIKQIHGSFNPGIPYYEIEASGHNDYLVKMAPGAAPLDKPFYLYNCRGRVHFLGIEMFFPRDNVHANYKRTNTGGNHAGGMNHYWLGLTKSPLMAPGTYSSDSVKSVTWEGCKIDCNGVSHDFIALNGHSGGSSGVDMYCLNTQFHNNGGIGAASGGDGFHADVIHNNGRNSLRRWYNDHVDWISNHNLITFQSSNTNAGQYPDLTYHRFSKYRVIRFNYPELGGIINPRGGGGVFFTTPPNDNTFISVDGIGNYRYNIGSGDRTASVPSNQRVSLTTSDIAPSAHVGRNYISPFINHNTGLPL